MNVQMPTVFMPSQSAPAPMPNYPTANFEDSPGKYSLPNENSPDKSEEPAQQYYKMQNPLLN